MKKMIALSILVFRISVNCFSQNNQIDEELIKSLIQKFSIMWTHQNGAQIAEQVISENFLYIVNQRSYNKKQYLSFLISILRDNKPMSHTHEIYNIQVKDNIAYEYGKIIMVLKNGTIQNIKTLNIFIKENEEWKLISNLPVEMMKAVLQD